MAGFRATIFGLALSLASWSAAGAAAPAPVQTVAIVVPAGVETRPVDLQRVVVNLESGARWGTMSTFYLCSAPQPLLWQGGAMDASSSALSSVFQKEVSKAGFKTARDPTDLFGAGPSSSDYSVGGVVNAMDAKLCAGVVLNSSPIQYTGEVSGAVSMSMEWQIYSNLEKRVVARVKTQGSFEDKRGRADATPLLINAAFAENVRVLINSEGFRAAFIGANRPAGQKIEATTQGSISMTAAKTVSTISDSVGSVVGVFEGSGFGSGVLVGEEGYIVTNSHVVGSSKTVKVRWSDGFETVGEVVRSDRRRDVALVKTSPHGRQALKLVLTTPQVGAPVYAIGMPLEEKYQGTMTKGIVSAMRIFDGLSFIQADVGVNHGNSGGPLLDEKANVIGLTVIGYQPDGVPIGINLFIPARDIVDFLSLELH